MEVKSSLDILYNIVRSVPMTAAQHEESKGHYMAVAETIAKKKTPTKE